MARVSYAEFKAERAGHRHIGRVERWFLDRPDVIAMVETMLAAHEEYTFIYSWLDSDRDDPAPCGYKAFYQLVTTARWERMKQTAAARGPA